VAVISSGMVDLDTINNQEVWQAAPYTMSKAAVNAVVAKFNARYRKDGILFIAISPGMVATDAAASESSHPFKNSH